MPRDDDRKPRVIKSAQLDGEPHSGASLTRRRLLQTAAAVGAAAAAGPREAQARSSSTRERKGTLCIGSEVRAFQGPVKAIFPDTTGRFLAARDRAGRVVVWDFDRPQEPLLEQRGLGSAPVSLGRRHLVWLSGGRLWSRDLSEPDAAAQSINLSGAKKLFPLYDRLRVGVADAVGNVRIVYLDGLKVEASFEPAPDMGTLEAMAPRGVDGFWALTAEGLYTVNLRREQWELHEPTPEGAELVLGPDGRRLLLVEPTLARVLTLADREELWRWEGELPNGDWSGHEASLRSFAVLEEDDDGTTGLRLQVRCLDDPRSSVFQATGIHQPTAFTGLPRARGYAIGDSEGRLLVLERPA
jgi:hypothetical protein